MGKALKRERLQELEDINQYSGGKKSELRRDCNSLRMRSKSCKIDCYSMDNFSWESFKSCNLSCKPRMRFWKSSIMVKKWRRKKSLPCKGDHPLPQMLKP
jgi:hypothetical protein